MAQASQLQSGIAVEALGPPVAAAVNAVVIAVAIVGVNAMDDGIRTFRDTRPVAEEPDAAAS
jgi:hypothetical protein